MNFRFIDLLKGNHRIHHEVKIGRNVRIGYGTVIENGCSISDNVLIAHLCVFRPDTHIGLNSVIGHGVVFEGKTRVGDRVYIAAQSHITLGVIIEDDVFVGAGVIMTNTNRIVHGRNYPLVTEAPVIRRAARVASNVSICPGIEIGENALVGIGSVVTKNVPAGEIWYGNPARFIKKVPKDELL